MKSEYPPVKREDIKVGDVITWNSAEGEYKVHRIAEIGDSLTELKGRGAPAPTRRLILIRDDGSYGWISMAEDSDEGSDPILLKKPAPTKDNWWDKEDTPLTRLMRERSR